MRSQRTFDVWNQRVRQDDSTMLAARGLSANLVFEEMVDECLRMPIIDSPRMPVLLLAHIDALRNHAIFDDWIAGDLDGVNARHHANFLTLESVTSLSLLYFLCSRFEVKDWKCKQIPVETRCGRTSVVSHGLGVLYLNES